VDRNEFLEGCTRTSARIQQGSRRVEGKHEPDRVARMVHLIRNPFHNVVARFHLERRHMIRDHPGMEKTLSNDATGFRKWCQTLDDDHSKTEPDFFTAAQLSLYRKAPCRGEFYKYTQWHNRVNDVTPLVGPGPAGEDKSPPVLIIHYEDYEGKLQETADQLLAFLELPLVAEFRPFRKLPDYSDHFSGADVKAVKALVQDVASEHTWKLVKRYFE
jgi:hypothetical protein